MLETRLEKCFVYFSREFLSIWNVYPVQRQCASFLFITTSPAELRASNLNVDKASYSPYLSV